MSLRTNWSGTVDFRARQIHTPATVDELRALVASSRRIRALGTAHSFSRVADTEADLVSVAELPPTIEVDRDARTVTVAAGVRYGAVAQAVHQQGLALKNMGSLPHISVAGACSTGTHGSGVRNANLASSVRAIDLVTADGDLVTLSREADPERFPGAVVALGALGVVVRLTLDLVPTFDMRQVVYLDLPESGLARDELTEVLRSAYSVSLFTRWLGPGADQVWIKQRVGSGVVRGIVPGGPTLDGSGATVAGLPDDAGSPFPATWRGARLADGAVHPLPSMPPENCTQQGGVVGPFHERLPHFRLEFTPSSGDEIQTEYLIPSEHAADALAALAEVREQIAPVLHISEIRTIAADDLWLSPSYGRDSVAVHFTWHKDPDGVAAVLPAVEERLAPFSPRPHWGKVFGMDADTVRAAYPRADDFRRLAAEMDPHGTFRNEFLDTYLPAL